MTLFAQLTPEAQRLIDENTELINRKLGEWIDTERKIVGGISGEVLRYLAVAKRRKNPTQKELKITFERKNAINKLVKQGASYNDFQIVIDCKIAKWWGHDIHHEHLRPETLFGKKFFSYLEEAKDWKAKGGSKAAGGNVGSFKALGE